MVSDLSFCSTAPGHKVKTRPNNIKVFRLAVPGLALLVLSIMSSPGFAWGHRSGTGTEFRSIDGSRNNRVDTSMGQTFTPLVRVAPNDYGDSVSTLAGSNRPSARAISLEFGLMQEPANPATGVSDYLWAWGQFVDHDIGITESAEPEEHADIAVPTGDMWFDPFATGTETIPFSRSIFTGSTSVANPRQQLNEITTWIDGSGVYGSDAVRASALRTNDGTGRLKISSGNLMPFNRRGLPNQGNGPPERFFLAGDVRANEQVGLTALHTLFVREHNRLARKFAGRNRHLNGEKIYQKARKIVGAQIQYITYHEYLPALLGNRALKPYRGYKPWVDASVANEFSTALYRYGHSAVGSNILRLDANLQEIGFGHLPLVDAFFSPERLVSEGGIGPVLRGLARQTSHPIDPFINNDLRNFLFGPPGAGGFDLASLNIQRGRDHGLPDYNSVRVAYGLAPVSSFAQISSNPAIQVLLRQLYGNVNNIDLWIGALSEDRYAGVVGELLYKGIKKQFEALRDGDRFWYQNKLSRSESRELARLSKIIRRNTEVGRELQRNVFFVR